MRGFLSSTKVGLVNHCKSDFFCEAKRCLFQHKRKYSGMCANLYGYYVCIEVVNPCVCSSCHWRWLFFFWGDWTMVERAAVWSFGMSLSNKQTWHKWRMMINNWCRLFILLILFDSHSNHIHNIHIFKCILTCIWTYANCVQLHLPIDMYIIYIDMHTLHWHIHLLSHLHGAVVQASELRSAVARAGHSSRGGPPLLVHDEHLGFIYIYIYTYIDTYIYIYTYVYILYIHIYLLYTYVYTYVYTYTHIDMYTFVYLYIYIYIYMYVYKDICRRYIVLLVIWFDLASFDVIMHCITWCRVEFDSIVSYGSYL